VADQVTTPAEKAEKKTPEEIEREMHQTREALTEKVAALETQVVGTVQTAADTLTDTVEAVKSFVSSAPEAVSDTVKQAAAAVSETVKDTFDITGHVRRHPWAAVGISALLGSIVGCLTARSRVESAPRAAVSPPMPVPTPPASRADEKQGVIDEFMDMLGDKAKDLARTALESVSSALKQNIESGVPKLVDEAASRLTETGADSGAPTLAGGFDARRARI
jgi:ElaB/YqjD/DUF883 family membrane-anchored ribosome-binding protein